MKKLFFKTLQLFCLFLFLSLSAKAQMVQWTGADSNDFWSNPNNWDTGTVPGSGNDVWIPPHSYTIRYDLAYSEIASLEISDSSYVLIMKNRELTLEGVAVFSIRVHAYGSLTNRGVLTIRDAGTGIDNRGGLYNHGNLKLHKVAQHGIENWAQLSNWGEITLPDAGYNTNFFSILVRSGVIANKGTIRFPKGQGRGMFVRGGGLLENYPSGQILFEDYCKGNLLSRGQINNSGLLQMSSDPYDGDMIRLRHGSFDNKASGVILIDFAASGGDRGIYLREETALINNGHIEIENEGNTAVMGIYVRQGSELENQADGKVILKNVTRGMRLANHDHTRFINAGEVETRWCDYGVINDRELTNTGNIRFYNSSQLENTGTLTNTACSDLLLYDGGVTNTGTFINDGWINAPVKGDTTVATSFIENNGVINDPYNRFANQITSNGVRIAPLESQPLLFNYYPALEIGNWGSYAVDTWWSLDFNQTQGAATYLPTQNRVLINSSIANGASYLYAEFYNFASGCSKVYGVRFTEPLSTFAPSPSPNNQATDRNAIALEVSPRQIQLFPNPSNGQFNFTLNQPLLGGTTLRLIDVTGRTVWAQKENDLQNLSFDFAGRLPRGVYSLFVFLTPKKLR